ncbi:rubrerythrin [Desulfosalsimonas propionicica]|uniref:Rubrerythrin n=1 Tax=Desulfosalsimonas propionicica TaxID=332175 RepID=A0A7W0HLY4_9BACT|nr:ferritin-like domain-containing protein [Desulfosalsimonas propionicica]MBA2882797.1 rubrerythrin [Desulfosalsimonas propionicica]
MPLKGFGVILTFAETIETENKDFYLQGTSQLPEGEVKSFLYELIKEKEKQIKQVQRVRRENVAEMILEPVEGFTRDRFLVNLSGVNAADPGAVVETARKIEERNLNYYREAAKKMKSHPEVASALQQLEKKQKKLLSKMDSL